MRLKLTLPVAMLVMLLPLTSPAQEMNEAVLWATIEKSTNADDFRAYLDKYPQGTFAPLAKRRLATLLEAKRATDVSEWEGREWFRKRRGIIRAAQETDPEAQSWTVAFRL